MLYYDHLEFHFVANTTKAITKGQYIIILAHLQHLDLHFNIWFVLYLVKRIMYNGTTEHSTVNYICCMLKTFRFEIKR